MAAYRFFDRKHLIPLSVLFLLSAIHFYCLYRYAINIPFSDDYNEILKYINLVQGSNSLQESINHLLHGVGYSKPITLRLVSLLHLSVFNEINFRYLVITGNVFLLLAGVVFIRSAITVNPYLIITTACFMFQPQYWEAIYQSTLSVSVFTCLFFSLASIYCITRQKTYYDVLAVLSAVLAQISFGNGFLVYPILLFVSIYTRNIKLAAAIFVTMILSTYLYLLGNTVSYSAGQELDLLTKLKLWSVWLLEFIGSSIGYANGSGYDQGIIGRTISMVIGFLIVMFYVVLLKKKYFEKNILLFSILTFFILTALLATKLRFLVEVPGASRYQIQSALCVLATLIIIVDLYAVRMNRISIIVLTIVFPLLFVSISYKTNLSNVSWHKGRLASGMWAWLTYGKGLTIWSGEDAAGALLIQTSSKNIYKIPSGQTLMSEAWKQ